MLIATAIVSIMFVPALAGFHSAALNQRYAADRYEAATQAELALLMLSRTSESGDYNVMNVPFLLHDKYNFIIDDPSNPVTIDFHQVLTITPSVNNSWNINDETHVFTGSDGGVLVLESVYSDVNDLRVITVDVYDKDGVFLIRAAQVVR